jgi:outer membrane receptor protein involved in Fe transport
VRYVGEYFIDANNTSKADNYTVVDVVLSYNIDIGTASKLFLRVDNIADKVYASTVNGLGASPGAPRAVYAGAQISF